jgi:glycosyltransferase involved in cell wall biosynthesis
MKKQVLITAGSMDIGGIERSLAGLLNAFDYEKYDVDLLLFSRKGELLNLLPVQCHVLPEIPQLASLLEPIKSVAFSGHILLATARLFSKASLKIRTLSKGIGQNEIGAALLQAYWDNSIKIMPKLQKEYDAVLSFMWPHHFAAKNVNAKIKIAWIHTDYTELYIDNTKDENIWNEFDKIAAVSDDCGEAFLSVYPNLNNKLITIENVLSAEFVRKQANEFVPGEMTAEGSIRILSVGRFCYAKAFDFAADICRRLIDAGLDIKWYIIGFGSDEALIRRKIVEHSLENSFIILGKKSNPYPYMKACDLYVQPSRYEGKAVTVREAQMLGKPVLITDFRTAAGQVKADYDAIISPMDLQSLTNNIIRLINDSELRKTLSAHSLTSDYSNVDQINLIYKLIEGGVD